MDVSDVELLAWLGVWVVMTMAGITLTTLVDIYFNRKGR